MVLAMAGVLQVQSLGHWESPRGYAEEGGLDRSTPDDGTVAAWWEHAAGDRRRGIRFRVLALPQPGESRAGSNPARSSPPPNLEESYVYEASLYAADRGSGSDRAVPYVWSDPEVPEPELAPPATPTAAAVVVQAASVGQLSREEAIHVLEAAGWPTELHEQALAIAWCESKYSPGAIGDAGNSLGWFQLWTGWFPAAGFSVSQAFDPHVNARTALYVYQTRGRWGGGGGWSCAALVGIY